MTIVFLVLVIIGSIGAAVTLSDEKRGKGWRNGGRGGKNIRPLTDQEEAWNILSGEQEMTLEISEKWGQKAHAVTNQVRKTKEEGSNGRLEELVWSDNLHAIAYQRCDEVAKGIIPYGQSNFMNLLNELRSIYEPKYEVVSFTEQLAKIVDTRQGEDYIDDWQVNWKIDH